MDTERMLHTAAEEAVKSMDKVADSMLPTEIAKVVKLHAKIAVGSAWIPVPGADVAAGAANIWGMYVRINDKLGLHFKENVIKSIGSGVATNLVSFIAMSGVASALKFIPGIGSLAGGLILSASLYAVTLASGYVYLKALSSIAEENNGRISEADLTNGMNATLKNNRNELKRFIDEAKKEYKK